MGGVQEPDGKNDYGFTSGRNCGTLSEDRIGIGRGTRARYVHAHGGRNAETPRCRGERNGSTASVAKGRIIPLSLPWVNGPTGFPVLLWGELLDKLRVLAMSSPTTDALEGFASLRRDLEQQVLLLKSATTPNHRMQLLWGRQLMLKRADQLISADE